MLLEPLEERTLLTVGMSGFPFWAVLGSSPMTSAGSTATPDNPASGAVEDVAIDPNDPGHMFVASVNGGIWRSANGDRPFNGIDDDGVNGVDDPLEQPDWEPLTDGYLSLAMGGIAFDPFDATGNTVFAGTGTASSLGGAGGRSIGVFRTTDGGDTWTVFPLNPGGSESQVRVVLPTTFDGDGVTPGVQQVVLVGASSNSGLYRSTDAGETYTVISGTNGLPTGAVTQIIVDPNNASRYFAGVVGSGVYRSDDGGLNWTAVNTSLTNIAGSTSIDVSAHPGGGTTVLYAMISGPNPVVFTSNSGGNNWTQLAALPAAFTSGFNNLYTTRASDQLTVDPSDSQIVYVSKGYGGGPQILRYDAGGGGSWVQISGAGFALGDTRPHVDNRDLLFATGGGGTDVLISANDGGIYFMSDPQNALANRWTSLHGRGATGLGVTEYHDVAWDSRFNVATGGAQDNGTTVQDGFLDPIWTSYHGADGGDVKVDPVNAGAGRSFRYASSQNFGAGFSTPYAGGLTRHTFDSATNEPIGAVDLITMSGLPNFSAPFVPIYELNQVDLTRLVTGGSGSSPVYELLNAATAPNAAGANWQAVPVGAGFTTVSTPAIAAGGREGGADNAEVLVVGSGSLVFVRSTVGGTLTATAAPFPGGVVQDLVLDPEDWQHFFVTDGAQVWETTDAGATAGNWRNLTGNLGAVNTRIQSVEFVPTGDGGVLTVGGNLGVSRLPLDSPAAQWTRFGSGLPNALTMDLEYNSDDDVLLAGTFGRGAYAVFDAANLVEDAGVLTICGDEDSINQDDTIRLARNELNPLILDVFLNSLAPVFSVALAAVQQINVFGQGGNDNLIVDSTNGLITVPDGIRYDGDGICFDIVGQEDGEIIGLDRGFDTLTLWQDDLDQQTSEQLAPGQLPGSGMSEIVGPDGTQTVYFEELEPIVTNVPAVDFTISSVPTLASVLQDDNAINYEASPAFGPTWGRITVDNFEPIDFTNKANLTLASGAGSDAINLNNANVPTALTSITVDAGDPTGGSDTVVVNGALNTEDDIHTALVDHDSAIVDITVDPSGVNVALPTVNVNETELLIVNGQTGGDALAIAATGNRPTDYLHTPGEATDAGRVDSELDGLVPDPFLPVEYAGLGDGSLTLELEGDADLTVLGTKFDDDLVIQELAGDQARITHTVEPQLGFVRIPILADAIGLYSSVVVDGQAGDDDIDWHLGPGGEDILFVTARGGDPSGSDVFTIIGEAGVDDDVTIIPGIAPDRGGYSVSQGGPTTTNFAGFSGIELVRVEANADDADSFTVQGTQHSDQIDLIRGQGGDRIEGSFQIPVEAVGIGLFDVIAVDLDSGGNDENDVLTVDLTELQAAANYEVIGDAGAFDELLLKGTSDADEADVVQTGSTVDATIDHDPGVAGDENTISFQAGQIGLLTIESLDGDDGVSVAGAGGADVVAVPLTVKTGEGDDMVDLADLTVSATVMAGDGDDLVDASGVANDDVRLTLFGEAGNDNLMGGDSPTGSALGDILDGGAGDDRMEGGRGQDILLGGTGSDLFVWVAGDGSDLMEGGAGDSDAMLFDASGGDNRLELFGGGLFGVLANPAPNLFGPGTLENGSRSIFALNSVAQDSAAVFLNMADVEQISILAGAGADQVILNNQANGTSSSGNAIQWGTDLADTTVQAITTDLGAGDGSTDNIEAHGRLTADDLNISVNGGTVDVAGFGYSIRTMSAEAANDRLFVHGQTGNDSIKAEPGVESTIAITLEGDAGDDILSADAVLIGGPGNDFLEGGPGDDQLFGNAGEDTMVGSGGNDTYDGGPDFDTILVRGTSGNDRIDLRQDSPIQLRYEVGNAANGFDGVLGGVGTETDTLVIATVEQVRIDAGDGDDTIRVAHDDALVAAGNSTNMLRIDVLGGEPGASDRLTVVDDGLGDTTIQRIGTPGDGSFTMYAFSGGIPANPIIALPPVVYTGVEYASLAPIGPVTGGTGTDGNGRLFVFKLDPFEQNQSLANATFLGANETTNVDPTIDPGADPLFGETGDEDWYRIVAEATGTLDIQVYFRQQGTLANGRAGLPGDGNLDIALYDADGLVNGAATPIAGTGAFGVNDSTDDERIRIPAVAGQTYYLRVAGVPLAGGDAQNESPAINIYNLSAVNLAPPTPFDLELADNLTILTGDQEVPAVSTPANGTANFQYDAVANTFDLDLFVYGVELTDTTAFPEITGAHIHTGAPGVNGPVIVTLSVGNAGWVQEPAGIRLHLDDAPFSAAAADITALLAGNTYVNIHTTDNAGGEIRGQILIPDVLGVRDTGRSQFDDVTQDNTPTIYVRVDDAILLNDLPGNAVGVPDSAPPDEVIPIPHNSSTLASPVGLAPGFRVAIYDEIDTHAPVFLGFAQPVTNLRGVYSFTFAEPLADGSHFLSARLQMIDPADNDLVPLTETPATGFGVRSDSLEIIVDTVPPPVLFGFAAVVDDGLHPDSDTGIEDQAETFVDRITSDTTPSFWGTAEADTIVYVYADLNDNDILEPDADLLLGKTVAMSEDGTNQHPNGQWNMTTNIDMNDPAWFPVIDGTRTIFILGEDLAGNVTDPADAEMLDIFIDTRGPQVNEITVTTAPAYDLFDPKPSTSGPTPLVYSLDIDFIDEPDRDSPFIYPAVNEILATAPGNIVVVGDYNGVIPVASIQFLDSTVDGDAGMTTVRLNFYEPLPDDRYTLTISDRIADVAFNALDGESHAQEPQESPIFPSGDGAPGEDFVGRFTVDSRPEVAGYAAGSVWVDTNGNTYFDNNNLDYTNRDIVYTFAFTSDDIFVGNFAEKSGDLADGFDKLAAYGRVAGDFRWIVDIDNDGAPDVTAVDALQLNGLPVAGRFDGNDVNGDEVGLYTADTSGGSVWYFDTNHDFSLDAASALVSDLHGVPIVGDFDGDGFDDLATWQDDTFYIDLAGGVPRGWDGVTDVTFHFGFIGVREQPVAADVDQDGYDDLGLWTPDRSGALPEEGSEWYILVSDGNSVLDRIVMNADLGAPAIEFTPVPFGPDLYVQFGDEYAMPLLGNFDPPVTPTEVEESTLLQINGTTGDDEFYFDAGSDGQTWTVKLNGVEQEIPEGTEGILFNGLTGNDTVFLRGSDGDDVFMSGPTESALSGSGFAVTAVNVEVSHGYGLGGYDVATMNDSSGSDKFKAKLAEDYAKMWGSGYYTRTKFFESVSGVFSEGDDDYARVWDSANDDQLITSPSSLTQSGGGLTVNIEAFDRLYAFSIFGGADGAELFDSPLDDTMRARSNKTVFWSPEFHMTLRGFDDIVAHAVNGGHDVAKLHDTLGNDVVLTGEEWGSLSTVVVDEATGEKLDQLYAAYGFDTVKAYHSGGNDRAPDPATIDFLMLDDADNWEIE